MRAVLWIVTLCLSFVFYGCGGGGGNSDGESLPATDSADQRLVGSWELQYDGDDPLQALTLKDDNTYSSDWGGGCTETGTWTATSDTLTVTVGNFTDQCDPEYFQVGEQDTHGFLYENQNELTLYFEQDTNDVIKFIRFDPPRHIFTTVFSNSDIVFVHGKHDTLGTAYNLYKSSDGESYELVGSDQPIEGILQFNYSYEYNQSTYFAVSAIINGEETRKSEPVFFDYDVRPNSDPETFYIQGPDHGSTIDTLNPTLSWTEFPNAASYLIWIGEYVADDDPSGAIVEVKSSQWTFGSGSQVEYDISNLKNDSSYGFHISALDEDGSVIAITDSVFFEIVSN